MQVGRLLHYWLYLVEPFVLLPSAVDSQSISDCLTCGQCEVSAVNDVIPLFAFASLCLFFVLFVHMLDVLLGFTLFPLVSVCTHSWRE